VADFPPSCVDGDSSLHPCELKCLEPRSILYGTGGTGAVTTERLQVHRACPISLFPECREYRLVVLCYSATRLYRVSSLSTPRRKEYDHSEEQVETRENLEENMISSRHQLRRLDFLFPHQAGTLQSQPPNPSSCICIPYLTSPRGRIESNSPHTIVTAHQLSSTLVCDLSS
jgi:hypothetical protein